MSILHILNGDSARMGLERSGIPGEFVVWPDILYEGPTPLATGEEWITARAGHLAGVVDEADRDFVEGYRRNDAALESFRDHEELVFWFEHDLFDQLLLIRHLWWLKERGAGGAGRAGRAGRAAGAGAERAEGAAGAGAARAEGAASAGAGRAGGAASAGAGGAGGARADTAERAGSAGAGRTVRLSLVCRDVYLGPLAPEEFPPLFAERASITDEQIELGARVWRAFCGDDPTRLLPFAMTPSPELPFLAAALQRFLEDYPSAANGLSRTEQQILRVVSDGPLTRHQAFRASTDLEAAIFMGDLSFFNLVEALGKAPHPLLIEDDTIRITDTGREVLASRADHIALNGISRWLGGVHLTRARLWRWTGSSLRPATA